MSIADNFFIPNQCFPKISGSIPFGDMIVELFYNPSIEPEFPLHGSNAVRFIEELLNPSVTLNTPGLVNPKDIYRVRNIYQKYYNDIIAALGGIPARERETEILKIGALYHDIGKFIRRANHPVIGANLLRNYNEGQRRLLVNALGDVNDPDETKHNRFSRITSIIQHHDKFGVVSTGEGGIPIFSDILYFTSNSRAMEGIKKNITSVMLTNLADIAAVTIGKMDPKHKQDAEKIAKNIYTCRDKQGMESSIEGFCQNLLTVCCRPDISLGLDLDKIKTVLEDWALLMRWVEDPSVHGDRVCLKRQLLEIERNPGRAIDRVLRLLRQTATGSNCTPLVNDNYLSLTSVESTLVGTLGAYQFQTFSELLATVVKLDYGLNFFKAIICATVRKELDKTYSAIREDKDTYHCLSDMERDELSKKSVDELTQIARKITTLFVKTLEGLINRYIGVFGYSSSAEPRRFGFQMRSLSSDHKIRNTIIDLLCVQDHTEHIALTWLGEEVTIWSMD
jgi:hypothetical protein